MTVTQRLSALRERMAAHEITAYLVPTEDFHGSEYVGDYFACRKYITGFTGSAGTALILRDRACLWTDGRYFLQAAMQLEGSGITLMKSGEEGVPTLAAFLEENLKEGDVLGFDGRTVSAGEGLAFEETLGKKGVRLETEADLVGEIWEDRPALPKSKAWLLSHFYAGMESAEKIRSLRRAMAEQKADYFLLTSLDDIGWLLNLRGSDVHCNPVILSYVVVSQSSVWLYAAPESFPEEVKEALGKAGVKLRPYDDVYRKIASLPEGKTLLLCREKVNFSLLRAVPGGVTVLDSPNPTTLPKAEKNAVEVANMKKAHIRDGVAVTRFIYWLKTHVGKEEITELSAAEKLEELRREGTNYQGPSFDYIMGYADHAAIIHYSATKESSVSLRPEGMLLSDTGGHYLEGTTDITRTIVLGQTTQEEKEYFTRVLRGHLQLSAAVFPAGVTGRNLDVLARGPLWEIGEDYNHGTGHGVGYLMNVHEGPQRLHWKSSKTEAAFEEGMITSNEPGYYRPGAFGIRHENLMVCVKKEKKDGVQWLGFEPLTLVPFDLEAVLPEQMSAREKQLLNDYHKKVFEKLAPHLNEEEAAWLRHATRAI